MKATQPNIIAPTFSETNNNSSNNKSKQPSSALQHRNKKKSSIILPFRSTNMLLLCLLIISILHTNVIVTNAFLTSSTTTSTGIKLGIRSDTKQRLPLPLHHPDQASNSLALRSASKHLYEHSKKSRNTRLYSWKRWCLNLPNKIRSKASKHLKVKNKRVRSILFGLSFCVASLMMQRQQPSQHHNQQFVASSSHNTQGIHRTLSHPPSWKVITGGGVGGAAIATPKTISSIATTSTSALSTLSTTKITESITTLVNELSGPRLDTLLLLMATALVPPLCQKVSLSPILGFLLSGMLLGPNGFALIKSLHTTEILAELGIVFFLFEMGIELSVERLKSMRKDVFGLGSLQFFLSSAVLALTLKLVPLGLSPNALVVVGSGLALSSSAFVLQLLKDKKELGTRFGKASFGILLFQDLAVVPLLVLTPILAGGADSTISITRAISNAFGKGIIALASIAAMGRVLVQPLFRIVASSGCQEAFLGLILLTVLGMSFLTEGLGLSNTLGAFLAGVLLSETKYRYQIEADIVPFRAILLGFFFMTVGFEIDLAIIAANKVLVASLVFGILLLKSVIATILSHKVFRLSFPTSLQTGLMTSQAGEFAFVTFTLARNLGLLTFYQTKVLLTAVALTMAFTPFLYEFGHKQSKKLEERSPLQHYSNKDNDCLEITANSQQGFVVVVGYGAVGKIVCDLLNTKFIKFIGLETNPDKAIQARNQGFPVFYGDVGLAKVAEAFNVGEAKAVILTIADKQEATRAVISLRRQYPNLKIFARARDKEHAQRLQKFMDVIAMVPMFPEDNTLLVLPFAGAVLRSLGAEKEEVNAILEQKRKELIMMRGGIDVAEIELEFAQMCINEVIDSSDSGAGTINPNSVSVVDTTADKTVMLIDDGDDNDNDDNSNDETSNAAVIVDTTSTSTVIEEVDSSDESATTESEGSDSTTVLA